MKTNHTPEPWRIGEKHPDRIFADRKSVSARERIALTAPFACDTDEASARDFANAARIVACVNACAGIDTDILESLTPGALPKLLEQRKRLIEAANRLVSASGVVGNLNHAGNEIEDADWDELYHSHNEVEGILNQAP